MADTSSEQPPQQNQATSLSRLENGIKHLLIFGSSLLLWAVVGVHICYHPVLVFGMIALYNEYLRDYWSILANESAEYGVWPGLLAVLQQEVLWILTITFGLTLLFWALRKGFTRSEDSLSEVLGAFVWEQVLSLGVAILACTLGAILVGSSFVFGMLFKTPISLEIGVIIEIVASSLLIFSLILSLSFWIFDLNGKPARKTAYLVILSALPIAIVGLIWAAHSFRIETHFTSTLPLPADFRIYSEDSHQNIQAGTDSGPEISVFDQVSKAGQSTLSAAETASFSWPNQLLGDKIVVMRSFYFAGADIVPGFMPAFYHHRPSEIELDIEDRTIHLTYQLTLQRAPSQQREVPNATEAPKDWQALTGNWHHRSVSGPRNGGWGIRLYVQADPEIPVAEQAHSYTVFATAPPRLETMMRDGTRYQRTLPFDGDIQSLSWHRQSAASLWINNTPAFYFFEHQPDHLEVMNPAQMHLNYNTLEFVPE